MGPSLAQYQRTHVDAFLDFTRNSLCTHKAEHVIGQSDHFDGSLCAFRTQRSCATTHSTASPAPLLKTIARDDPGIEFFRWEANDIFFDRTAPVKVFVSTNIRSHMCVYWSLIFRYHFRKLLEATSSCNVGTNVVLVAIFQSPERNFSDCGESENRSQEKDPRFQSVLLKNA